MQQVLVEQGNPARKSKSSIWSAIGFATRPAKFKSDAEIINADTLNFSLFVADKTARNNGHLEEEVYLQQGQESTKPMGSTHGLESGL